jgi:hypothetical protein
MRFQIVTGKKKVNNTHFEYRTILIVQYVQKQTVFSVFKENMRRENVSHERIS